MELPSADVLKAILEAARATGVSKLTLGEDAKGRAVMEAEFGPYTQADMVAAINKSAPLPADPIAVLKGQTRNVDQRGGGDELPDVLDALANGARLVESTEPDPTSPS